MEDHHKKPMESDTKQQQEDEAPLGLLMGSQPEVHEERVPPEPEGEEEQELSQNIQGGPKPETEEHRDILQVSQGRPDPEVEEQQALQAFQKEQDLGTDEQKFPRTLQEGQEPEVEEQPEVLFPFQKMPETDDQGIPQAFQEGPESELERYQIPRAFQVGPETQVEGDLLQAVQRGIEPEAEEQQVIPDLQGGLDPQVEQQEEILQALQGHVHLDISCMFDAEHVQQEYEVLAVNFQFRQQIESNVQQDNVILMQENEVHLNIMSMASELLRPSWEEARREILQQIISLDTERVGSRISNITNAMDIMRQEFYTGHRIPRECLEQMVLFSRMFHGILTHSLAMETLIHLIILKVIAILLSNEDQTHLLALEGPPRLLALEGPPRLLALEGPPRLLALESPPRLLALEGPLRLLSLECPSNLLAPESPPSLLNLESSLRLLDLGGPSRLQTMESLPRLSALECPPIFSALECPSLLLSMQFPLTGQGNQQLLSSLDDQFRLPFLNDQTILPTIDRQSLLPALGDRSLLLALDGRFLLQALRDRLLLPALNDQFLLPAQSDRSFLSVLDGRSFLSALQIHFSLSEESEMCSELQEIKDVEGQGSSERMSVCPNEPVEVLAVRSRKSKDRVARKSQQQTDPFDPGQPEAHLDPAELQKLLEYEIQDTSDPGVPQFSDPRELLRDMNFGEMKDNNSEIKAIGVQEMEPLGDQEMEPLGDLETEVDGDLETEGDGDLETEGDGDLEREGDGDLEIEECPFYLPECQRPNEEIIEIPEEPDEVVPNVEFPNNGGNRPFNRNGRCRDGEARRMSIERQLDVRYPEDMGKFVPYLYLGILSCVIVGNLLNVLSYVYDWRGVRTHTTTASVTDMIFNVTTPITTTNFNVTTPITTAIFNVTTPITTAIFNVTTPITDAIFNVTTSMEDLNINTTDTVI